MGLLDADTIEDLMRSSSLSKGIEKTMERMINELELDSIYIVRYDEDLMQPEVMFDWESNEKKHAVEFGPYFQTVDERAHFDESDMFVARATTVLPVDEKELYTAAGYEAVVEFQMKNHGNVIGYILLGWNRIKDLTEEEESNLHVLLKLMNEVLVRQFNKEVLGESDWRISKLASKATKTMIYMVDEDYRIHYINNFAKEECPNIKPGDFCYEAFRGENAPCKDCPFFKLEEEEYLDSVMYLPYLEDSFRVSSTKVKTADRGDAIFLALQKLGSLQSVDTRNMTGKKFIFALQHLYKDIIAVEIRRDTFYNMLEKKADNKHSYSMDFVLKWLSKVHLDDKQKFLECFDINFLQSAYESGINQKEIDFRYRTHEGGYHCMSGRILFEHTTNKEVMVYILFQDVELVRSMQIEEEKQLRESLMAARSAAELKGQVLANISHEIRTPMSGIMSMSSVAKQIYNDEKRLLECLTNIDSYAEHMMQVMDSLLETVKVDQDSIIIARQPFNLEGFLNRIDIAVRERIEKKNVQFHISVQSQFKHLLGDDIRLNQAMVSLINNSISYTPISGEIRLTAKQIAADSKSVYIRFMIDDTGNGLTDKMKESIFGFSHNAEDGVIDEQHFDLSLASRIIQLMGGQIGVDVNGSGTHLYFTIRFELQNDAKDNKPVKSKKNTSIGNFEGKKILIAEDSDMAQDALRAVLEVVGFEVDAAENGKKAVIRFISQPAFTYDAVLMDVHMPLMDGREATKCIRISGKEDAETVPIIGLMANTYDKDVEESLQVGMQAHLAKPVDVDTLYKVLRKLIPEIEELDAEE
ncbi:MAG: response regulator [Lachnospiraceae bacterium]|nr:response regulator [Lachnospiraceae bacterium]